MFIIGVCMRLSIGICAMSIFLHAGFECASDVVTSFEEITERTNERWREREKNDLCTFLRTDVVRDGKSA